MFDPRDDFPNIIDGLEPVTLLHSGLSEDATDCRAIRRVGRNRQGELSPTRSSAADAAWYLPATELTEPPRPGDQIVDAEQPALGPAGGDPVRTGHLLALSRQKPRGVFRPERVRRYREGRVLRRDRPGPTNRRGGYGKWGLRRRSSLRPPSLKRSTTRNSRRDTESISPMICRWIVPCGSAARMATCTPSPATRSRQRSESSWKSTR